MRSDAQSIIDSDEVFKVSAAVILTINDLHSDEEPFVAETAAQAGYLRGWFTSIRRQAMAVLTLTQAGLDHECAPLLRGMVEHAVLIRLLVQHPAVWRTVERARLAQVAKFQKWLVERGYEPWAELDRHREGLGRPSLVDDPSMDLLAAFRHQCEALGEIGDVSYARYQYLTHQSHGSVETAMRFTEVAGCACPTCQGNPPLSSPTGVALAALVLLDTVPVLNELLAGRPWTEVLRDMEQAVQPIRTSMGGAPFHIDRSELA